MNAPVSSAVRRNPVLTVVALCLGGLGVSLSQTLVIPIQSDLPTLLGTSASNTSWVVTITLLGGAVAMPIAGRVADMLGKQRVLMTSAICCWSARWWPRCRTRSGRSWWVERCRVSPWGSSRWAFR